MKEHTCCFTGHRILPEDKRDVICAAVEQEVVTLIQQGYRYFGAGGALGFDTMAALIVLKLREIYPDIRLVLVLPCPQQHKGWPAEGVALYEEIKRRADKVVYTARHYYRGCMQARNRHLVNSSSACIGYVTRDTGGSAYTLRYAAEKGLRIIRIQV